MRNLNNTLTVDELIEILQDLKDDHGGDIKVVFSYNYGDYWRTQVASGVEEVDTGYVEYSDYHNMPKVVNIDSEDIDVEKTQYNHVIILKC